MADVDVVIEGNFSGYPCCSAQKYATLQSADKVTSEHVQDILKDMKTLDGPCKRRLTQLVEDNSSVHTLKDLQEQLAAAHSDFAALRAEVQHRPLHS